MFQLHNDGEPFSIRFARMHKGSSAPRTSKGDNITPTTRTQTTAATETVVGVTNQTGIRHMAGSGACVPLRSHTVIAPRLQLRTYYDSSEIRAALERLRESCGASSLSDVEELVMRDHIHGGSDPTCSQLNRIPGHVILYCFAFCDIHSLCVLACVNRRLSALANAHHLWEAHARELRVPVRAPMHAREEIRRAFQQQEEREQAEVRRHEHEYEELERRLLQRTAADRVLSIDVEAALLAARNNANNITGGNRNSHNHDSSPTSGAYSRNSDGATTHTSGDGTRRSIAEDRALQERLEQIESMKLDLLRSMSEIKSTLEAQERQIQQLQERLEISQTRDTANAAVDGRDSLTLADVQSFERRICHVLLRGVSDLPLVLRRGIDDFSTMELLCLYGGGDVGQHVRQRWAAFKRFFPPLSNDYVAVRQALLLPPSSPRSTTNATSARLRESFARVGGVMRRVQMMTDQEIVQIVM